MAEAAHDVVIIGAGAGGGSVAYGLARAGVRVLLLEAGPRFDPAADFRLDLPAWELSRFPHKPGSRGSYSYAELQRLDPHRQHLRSYNVHTGRHVPGERRQANGYHHVRGVGGSTLHFTGEAHRLNPRAMRLHSEYGVGADWPLDYAELEPWYEQAEQVIGVAGPAQTGQRPRRTPCPLPAHPLSWASRKLAAGAAFLGWGWEPNTLAALSRPYDGRPGCNYCLQCNRGCPRGDKGSVDITFLRAAQATGNCTIRSGVQVTRLLTGAGDRVSGLEYRDGGREQHLQVPVVVLCAGSIETPRLLLASSGLGNESGQVGRNFLETLSWASIGLHPEPLGSHRGLPSDSICWDFNAPDAIPGVIGGLRLSPVVGEADLSGPFNYATRVVGGWGLRHKQAMRARFGHALGVGAIGECLPDTGSYVDLDPDQADAAGMPLARIHSHLGDMAVRRLDFMAGRCHELLIASGVDTLVEEYGSYDLFSATHVFGTCRMGHDPEHSVVNADCRSHRWANLYIVDGSVFPSSGGGEAPSLTIEALGLRAAEHIRIRA
jgi:choline dehydrogenase-like flavoprotein